MPADIWGMPSRKRGFKFLSRRPAFPVFGGKQQSRRLADDLFCGPAKDVGRTGRPAIDVAFAVGGEYRIVAGVLDN